MKRNRPACHAAVCLLAVVSMVLPLVVLIGWILDVDGIKSLIPGLETMKVNTAIGFVLAGLSIWSRQLVERHAWAKSLAISTASAVLLMSLLTLIEYVADVNLGIDELLIRDPDTALPYHPGRMSAATALGLCLVGCALLVINLKTCRRVLVMQTLAFMVLLLSLIALVSYVVEPASLYDLGWFRSLALNTALLFLLVGVAILLLEPGAGFMKQLTSPLLGGQSARTIIPLMILAPLCSEWLLMMAIQAELIGFVMALNLFVVSNTMTLFVIVWYTAKKKNQIHAELLERNELLQSSEAHNALLAAIVTGAKDAIVSLNQQNRITVWNKGAEVVFGVPASEAMNQPLREIISVEKLHQEWLPKARAGETVSGLEVTLAQKDGKLIDVSITISAVDDSNGKQLGLSLIARDMTHLHQLQIERDVASRDLIDFKAALDEHAIVAMTDARGRITYVNEKFCTISKYSREELIGQDHRILNSGCHSKEFFKDLWGTISQGEVWRGEIRNRAKDGEHYWVDTTIVPFLDDDGRPRQYVAIRADVTERVRSSAVLARQAEELARSNADLEQFAYIASHDLQEPLRGIDGCVQLLARRYRDKLDDGGKEFIDHTVGNVSRMQRLIRDLLSYSRVGTRSREFQSLSLGDLVSDAKLNLATAIEESHAEITQEGLPEVFGDYTQLSQVFQNLLSNALKFSQSTPRVHISAQRHESHWEITVTDNGIGIRPEYFDRIFVIFQRLHNRELYPGTGIGLALCKRIIQRHGGQIWVESQEGEGCAFHFTLRDIGQTVRMPGQPELEHNENRYQSYRSH